MISARRRTVVDSSTAVKQWRGIAHWSKREMASARRIDISTAMVKQLSTHKMDRSRFFENRDLSTAVQRWGGNPQWPSRDIRFFENRFIRNGLLEVGYTVDVADLLFTPERDFLVKNNGQKIKVDDLRGKTIVLFIVPLHKFYGTRQGAGDTWDMIDAYYELLRVGGSDVEFVFVPVRLHHGAKSVDGGEEALFNELFSAMPFPAIPFSDVQGPEGPVVQTFSVDDVNDYYHFDDKINNLPYWVVIDPTNTVVATRCFYTNLFKLFGGAELHPLSRERIEELDASLDSESVEQRINKWDQLLASDTRDFLLSSNGDKVPISSLKGKVVGLYFCENIPHPPRLQAIKKVYEEAKSRGYDFEIVQITFHYDPLNAKHLDTDPTVKQCREDVSWLTLPFKDPSCRKLQRILRCVVEEEDDFDDREHWKGDSLVLIYPRQGEAEADHSSGIRFELSGGEIFKRWGIEGYPFTRQSLYKAEYEVQKREITSQFLLPATQCLLRPVGDGIELADARSQLSGKRVLVLFTSHSGGHHDCGGNFVSMLKSEYEAQLEDNVEEESMFEVMYVSTRGDVSSFKELIKDMPWLVLPISSCSDMSLLFKVFKVSVSHTCVAAFNEKGELIAKAHCLPEVEEGDKLRFPFIDQDLEKYISAEVEAMCNDRP